MSTEGLRAGCLLLGRYRVGAVLGSGGMGVVYEATDTRLDRPVALKVLNAVPVDADIRDHARARFKREAMTAARLRHPNVTRIYDYETDAALDLDILVMELLEGMDLAQWLKAKGTPPLPVALDILCQAASGLAAGHRAGLVHRDVKPGNLFISDAGGRPHVHLLDFGIVELTDADTTRTNLTAEGMTPGTPRFASPEQLAGLGPLTPASDVYSLGATAFELLTGERAFSSGDVHEREVQSARLAGRLAHCGIPAAIAAAILRALAFAPETRFQDAAAFGAAIELAGDSRPSPMEQPQSFAGTAGDSRIPATNLNNHTGAEPATAIGSHSESSRRKRAMSRWLAGLVGVAILTALLWRVDPPPPPNPDGIPDTIANPFPSEAEWRNLILPPIQNEYRNIQQRVPFLVKQGYPVAGGFAEVYTDGDQVQTVTVTRPNGAHQVVDHMYFRGDSLFFVHRRTIPKAFGAAGQPALEDRFYFHSGHLVRWRDSAQKVVPETAQSFVAQQVDLLERSQQIMLASRGAMPSLSAVSSR